MKKVLCIILCLFVVFSFCACSEGKTISGHYIVDSDDFIHSPYIYFNDDNTFVLGGSVYASYAEFGDYEIKGGKLFATSKHSTYVFEFISSKQLYLIKSGESMLNFFEGIVFTFVE